jgi:hypothetical protein
VLTLPEALAAWPKGWLDKAAARFGEPTVTARQPFDGPTHSSNVWGWIVDRNLYSVMVRVESDGWVRTTVRGAHRNAEIGGWELPADADLQRACAFTWPELAADDASG